MDLTVIKDILTERFKEDINSYCIQNSNELYFEIQGDKIRDIAIYLYEKRKYVLVSMFANDERSLETNGFVIYYVFADRENGVFIIPKLLLSIRANSFISIADRVYAASGYEREIKNMFGLEPLGHPEPKDFVFHGNWPKKHFPLLKNFDRTKKPKFVSRQQEYMHVKGEGVFEIPVGPVHAGIIEPGHFRFNVAGENIINLEAQLYFVHKGIEKMCEGMDIDRCFYVSERISGDETFSNSLAFCQAVEKIGGIEIPIRAKFSRVIFAELERLTSHLGDLAGICLDVAYGFAAFQFRMMRGWAYLVADELCGMRFLRSVNTPGGIRKDFLLGKEKKVLEDLNKIKAELLDTRRIIKENSYFLARVERTGVLTNIIAKDLNATGPGGRASGIMYDVRKAFPYAAYGNVDFEVPEHHNGDVNCRMNVKLEESLQSIQLMNQAMEMMFEGKVSEPIGSLPPYTAALGITESPRGENIHWLMTGENNTVYRYKIRTPSFCNWPAVCYAVRDNIVPDFPLINKSFNLSYAGNDL